MMWLLKYYCSTSTVAVLLLDLLADLLLLFIVFLPLLVLVCCKYLFTNFSLSCWHCYYIKNGVGLVYKRVASTYSIFIFLILNQV